MIRPSKNKYYLFKQQSSFVLVVQCNDKKVEVC